MLDRYQILQLFGVKNIWQLATRVLEIVWGCLEDILYQTCKAEFALNNHMWSSWLNTRHVGREKTDGKSCQHAEGPGFSHQRFHLQVEDAVQVQTFWRPAASQIRQHSLVHVPVVWFWIGSLICSSFMWELEVQKLCAIHSSLLSSPKVCGWYTALAPSYFGCGHLWNQKLLTRASCLLEWLTNIFKISMLSWPVATKNIVLLKIVSESKAPWRWAGGRE